MKKWKYFLYASIHTRQYEAGYLTEKEYTRFMEHLETKARRQVRLNEHVRKTPDQT